MHNPDTSLLDESLKSVTVAGESDISLSSSSLPADNSGDCALSYKSCAAISPGDSLIHRTLDIDDHDDSIMSSNDMSGEIITDASGNGVTARVPYFERLENLGLKAEGTLYRLSELLPDQKAIFTIYNQYEHVNYLGDRVAYSSFQLVGRCNGGDWVVCKIYITPVHILQSTGSTYDDEPRWMLCEGVTDQFSHAYVTNEKFNNPPGEYQRWTKIVQAFIHYVYDLSNSNTVITSLECDKHGSSPPYHSRHIAGVAEMVQQAFIRFPDEHVCNELLITISMLRYLFNLFGYYLYVLPHEISSLYITHLVNILFKLQ
ncbi:uncharacterized protein MELLADRAFT_114520 [Melampsora larici-populina 98AG31]|uniref:Alpha-type protein kinase domain-containing protein n=1 Tax=Melampsora larici-populina (strain 98AG31 / pathotype 3-4-7) TaxID=747676 RepID=F4SDT2_MELLP|nr:uncharacterized protein MELLADRAFT_114520 [Melampsora larici-populina 98AG31]EGF97196.1 hypothetical protein MELLADRAFT_114520 [Melampsora larici-populina 98AG31]